MGPTGFDRMNLSIAGMPGFVSDPVKNFQLLIGEESYALAA